MLQCPHCKGFGVYAIRRSWWQRLCQMSHRYDCHDCGRVLQRSELVETRPAPVNTQDALAVQE